MRSQRSGRNLSTTMPQASEPATKIAAVGGEDPAEVGVGLERGDEPVRAERDDAGGDPPQAAVFAHALPDQPGTADLGEGGDDEQGDRPEQPSWRRDEVPSGRDSGRRAARAVTACAAGLRCRAGWPTTRPALRPRPARRRCAGSDTGAAAAQPAPPRTPAASRIGRTQHAAQASPARPVSPEGRQSRARRSAVAAVGLGHERSPGRHFGRASGLRRWSANGIGQQGLAGAGDQVVAAGGHGRAQRVADDGAGRRSSASTSASLACARACRPGVRPAAVAVAAGLEQVGDLVEGEARAAARP